MTGTILVTFVIRGTGDDPRHFRHPAGPDDLSGSARPLFADDAARLRRRQLEIVQRDRDGRAGYREAADPARARLVITTVRRNEYDQPAWVSRLVLFLWPRPRPRRTGTLRLSRA